MYCIRIFTIIFALIFQAHATGVVVTGNKYTSKEYIVNIISGAKSLQEIRNRLSDSGIFQKSFAQIVRNTIYISVQENPVIHSVEIVHGKKSLFDKNSNKKNLFLAALPIKAGLPFSQKQIDISSNIIMQNMSAGGTNTVSVIPMVKKAEKGLKVTFFVSNKALYVHSINIAGNKKIQTPELMKYIPMNASSAIGQIMSIISGPSNKYSDYLLNNSIKGIQSTYYNKGYFDAQVSYNIIVNQQDKQVDIKFLIHEGVRYSPISDIGYLNLSKNIVAVNNLASEFSEKCLKSIQSIYKYDIFYRCISKINSKYSTYGVSINVQPVKYYKEKKLVQYAAIISSVQKKYIYDIDTTYDISQKPGMQYADTLYVIGAYPGESVSSFSAQKIINATNQYMQPQNPQYLPMQDKAADKNQQKQDKKKKKKKKEKISNYIIKYPMMLNPNMPANVSAMLGGSYGGGKLGLNGKITLINPMKTGLVINGDISITKNDATVSFSSKRPVVPGAFFGSSLQGYFRMQNTRSAYGFNQFRWSSFDLNKKYMMPINHHNSVSLGGGVQALSNYGDPYRAIAIVPKFHIGYSLYDMSYYDYLSISPSHGMYMKVDLDAYLANELGYKINGFLLAAKKLALLDGLSVFVANHTGIAGFLFTDKNENYTNAIDSMVYYRPTQYYPQNGSSSFKTINQSSKISTNFDYAKFYNRITAGFASSSINITKTVGLIFRGYGSYSIVQPYIQEKQKNAQDAQISQLFGLGIGVTVTVPAIHSVHFDYHGFFGKDGLNFQIYFGIGNNRQMAKGLNIPEYIP